MELIKIEKTETGLRTTSNNVSTVFKKRHSDIIRVIENLKISNNFRVRNFTQGTYIDLNNQTQQNYTMTRDGWSILVMGFTGKKAMKFKEKFIEAFNILEKQINQVAIPQTMAEALQLAANQAKELEEAKPKIEFCNSIENSVNSISVGEYANLLSTSGIEIGQNRLFKFFYDEGYLINSSRPYQTAINSRWFEVEKYVFKDHFGMERSAQKILVTGRGQVYFAGKLAEYKG